MSAPQQLVLQTQEPPIDKTTQQGRILELLRSANVVILPQILDLRIANYRARISELREQGYDIRCELTQVNGQKHSRYRLNP